jgi:hypothetical protein
MKPTQSRIADLWCRLMHAEPMWPSHGQYECRSCGRRHRVCWDQPESLAPRELALHHKLLTQDAQAIAIRSGIQCLYQ